MSTASRPASPKDTPAPLAYPPEKEKDVEMGKSEATPDDLEATDISQVSVPNEANDEEKGEVSADPFEVWWDEPADQDPENPKNWPMSKKWTTIAVLSTITFLTYVSLKLLYPLMSTNRVG